MSQEESPDLRFLRIIFNKRITTENLLERTDSKEVDAGPRP